MVVRFFKTIFYSKVREKSFSGFLQLLPVVVFAFLFLVAGVDVLGQKTWDGGAGTSNWGDGNNWNPNGVPLLTDNVTIANDGTLTVNVNANNSCNGLTLSYTGNTNGTIALNVLSGNTLTVTNNISLSNSATNGGSIINLTVNGGTLICSSIGFTQSGHDASDCILTLSDANSTVDVSGNVTMGADPDRSSVVFSAAAILNIGGTMSGGTFTSGTGTVNYNNAGAQTIGTYTYYNLTLSGSGAKTTTGATVNNMLSLEGSATATGTAPAYGAAASLRYMGSVPQTTGTEFTTPWAGTGGVLIENTNGVTLNAIKTIDATSRLTIGGTVANSVFNDGGFQLTSTGTINLTSGTFRLGSAGTATTWPAFGTRNIAAGTIVEYAAGVAQTISTTPAYRNLVFSGAGTKTTAAGTLSVAEEWSLSGGTAALNTNNSSVTAGGNITGAGAITSGTGTISVFGDFSNSGTFTSGTGTVNYNGTNQQMKGATYYNLRLSNGGTKTLQASSQVNRTLTLNTGILQIGDYDLFVNYNIAAAITGAAFSTTNMIATDGTGYLIKNAASAQTLYPVGGGGYYSPATLTITSGSGGTVSARAVPTSSLGTGFIPKYWDVLVSAGPKTFNATFVYSSSEGGVATSAWFKDAGAWQTPPPTGTVTLGTYSATITGTTDISTTSTLWSIGIPNTYYSYQTGSWNTPTTWTSDPGGTTQVGTTIPGNNDYVVILSGRTVTLPANIVTTGHDITINEGGFLDLFTYQFTGGITSLSGQGTLKIASSYFPAVTTNSFVNAGGGTTEFYGSSDYNLPSQTIYNHLTINKAGATATLVTFPLSTLNGNLYVKNGTFQINNATAQRLQLIIGGNVTVDATGHITTGTGVTNSTTNPVGIAGSTGGYLNYYELHSHRLEINGDFTNNGSVRFTNLNFPVFNAFPPTVLGATTGFVTVYFKGSSNSSLLCNGQTDFYNLILDKGIDQTFSLTVQPSTYSNFRLFGANTSGGENPGANPDLKKALWIRAGTLILKGLTALPSLTEGSAGGTPVSNFVIPAKAGLVLDGPDVIVLATADDYGEVNVAYGVSGGTGAVNGVNVATNPQGLLVYGNLQVNDGYLSTRESAGILYDNVASGTFEINGGVVDAKQFRENGTTGSGASFSQTGGSLILRGRFVRPVAFGSISAITNTAIALTTRAANGTSGTYGTFNVNNASNIFAMTNGIIRIYDVCGTTAPVYAIELRSSVANTNVTGGTVEILSTHEATGDATPQLIYSVAAPFGNLTINRAADCASDVQLNTYPLTVLNNLAITNGSLLANNLNVTVGGNFTVGSTGTYHSGTNTTSFNGSANQSFTIDGTINNGAAGLRNLAINKSTGTLSMAGTQASLTVQGTFNLTDGILDDGGKTIYIAGNITNSGTHLSTPGTGLMQLNGTATQTIGGDGSGVFNNLELNNNNAATAPVSLTAGSAITGTLTFSRDKLFNIASYNLQLSANSTIVNGGALRYIQTSGGSGDGGITKFYSASANSFNFPIGAPTISPARAVKYTPAIIGINGAATAYGSITVIPVGYEHPATKVNGFSLTYFWRVKSSGFTLGSATITHGYTYGASDMTGITTAECVAARYNGPAYTWTTGTANDVDETNRIIGEPGTGSFLENVGFIDGDYTAGDNVGQNPFAAPAIYYSRQNGPWSTLATWSLTSHTVTNAPATAPGINDIVIIGNGNTVNLTANASCASLQIEAGSTLDIYTWSTAASNFSMVLNHPNGNGLFRLTTTVGSPKLFTFPSGDFTDFNVNGGTTEYYTIDGAVSTIYILPPAVTSYGNLILSPLDYDNLALPNNSATTIYGDLTCNGNTSDAWLATSWSGGTYGAVLEKTVTIKGNLNVNGGTFIYYNTTNPQHIIVEGDVFVAPAAAIDVYYNNTNTMAIGGSLINNTNSGTSGFPYFSPNIVRFRNGASRCNVTFFGSTNESITNTAGNPTTIFNLLTINKGTSQATTLTCDIAGTLTTNGTQAAPNDAWLTLQNGTFIYNRTGDFSITTGSTFTIPGSAGLYINTPSDVNIANSNVNTNDLYLDGKLTIINGRVFVGRETGADINHNDIEYSGAGASEIDVQGGTLFVNGQIRRNPATTDGVLKYSQSGTSFVIINGQNANTTCAKLEVFNNGSSFDMSDASTLTIVRGGGGNTYGDLYLRPASSSVTGGTILFTQTPAIGAVADALQSYQLDATVPINNLTITGKTAATARNATVKLMINPLVLNGTLTLSNTNSIFDANTAFNIDVTIKGDLDNSGTYNHFNNTTYFTGGVQNITGTSAIDFYNLSVNPVTSLTLNGNATVNRSLSLLSGTMACSTYKVTVKKDVTNNATYTDNNGGIILSGGTSEHILSGSGTYGQLELNDAFGARTEDDITLQKNLLLTQGILDINQHLLTLGQNSNIVGSGYGTSKMITSDGAFSNVGIKKIFGSPLATTFTYPLGTSGKYTPAVLTITANGSVGSIRVNNINSSHPAVFDPGNVLQYYWEVESSGITGFAGTMVLNYLAGDASGGPESNYVAARLIIPGTSWSKAAPGAGTDNVDETNHDITFNFTAGTSNLSGEYTAGNDVAIPDNVPVFTSNSNGNWNNPAIWTQTSGDPFTLTGGPNGFIVIIDHVVSTDANYCEAYRTTINNELRIVAPFTGHNLGTVDGSGTLYLESGTFPAGRYTSFFDCAGNSTLEYGGSGDYALLADLYSTIPNLLFTGTGTRSLPDKDLTICNVLEINGPTLDNSTYNRKVTIQGSMVLTSGAFSSGTGAGATVTFAGSAAQTLSGFTGTNTLNNLEVDNAAGLTLSGPIDIKRNLLLTDGIITTTSTNILTITNTALDCVSPEGGSAASYINGPMVKRLNQGDSYFQFPIGNSTTLGNKLSLRATETGTLDWKVEYINPSALNTYSSPLTAVNEEEYWNVSTPGGGSAIVNIQWDPSSDLTPLMTQNGLSDMRVAEHNGTDWIELASTAAGDNYNGSAETTSKVTISAGGSENYTLACINTPKPRIRLSPTGPICGTAGIPVTLSTSYTIFSPYTVSYSIDGAAQTPLNPASFPTTIPTGAAGGVYQLTGFTYNYPAGNAQTGVFDITSVTTYAVPTTSDAGDDQSLCGATNATLEGNTPVTGSGLWSIIAGAGGTVETPTVATSDFNGTNGTTYTLRWTISNGTCTSSDDVTISFPLLAAQPSSFTSSSANVCQGQSGIAYIVPNDLSVTYNWSYTGTGHTIHGTGNSVTVDFDATATSGTLSVTATNTCGTSDPRTIDITVSPLPSITVDPATSEACRGEITAGLYYTGTSNSPDQYSIVYSAGAITEGFANVNNAPLGASPVNLVIPALATAGGYNAELTVRNSATGCVSTSNAFIVTIHALPTPALAGNDTTCQSAVELYNTEAGMSAYSWTVNGGTIDAGGSTREITVTWGSVTGQYEDRTVSVNYTDTNGCSAASDTQIAVRVFRIPQTGPGYHIPNEHNE